MLWSPRASPKPTTPAIPPPDYFEATSSDAQAQHEHDGPIYSSVALPAPCKCEFQQPDFCPYCDYEHSRNTEDVPFPRTSTYITSPGASTATLLNSTSPTRPRKLKKAKQSFHHRAPITHSVSAPSVLSSDGSTSATLASPSPLRNEATSNLTPRMEGSDRPAPRKRAITITEASPTSSRGGRKVVRSKSFVTKSPEKIGPRPRAVSGTIQTNALVSLAWTGELSPEVKVSQPLTESPYNTILLPNLSPEPKSEPSSGSRTPEPDSTPRKRRPTLLKKASRPSSVATKKSWTLAMVITDDGITDEKLVDDLETMRIRDLDDNKPGDYPLGLGPPPPSVYKTELYATYAEYPPEAEEVGPEVPLSPSDASWNSARRVLLLCRELVRTERRYLNSLKTLITNGTSAPPPPRMLPYLPPLIEASELVLAQMEENPSVEGVSKALLNCEPSLKDAFTKWGAVVGEFFFPDEAGNAKVTVEDVVDVSPTLGGMLSRPRLSSTSLRTQSADSGLSVVIPEPNKIRRNVKARPLVRDLAILPTQRIARYVLMFKELRSLTPAELPSSAIVTRALQAAEAIAASANEAQAHVAFQTPPPSKGPVSSSSPEAIDSAPTSSSHN